MMVAIAILQTDGGRHAHQCM